MQPYFFPYLGYFSLIANVDEFILLDSVQFIRHGWIERNRILNPNGGWQYIRVPLLKHSRETKINDIKIDNSQLWKEKILSQMNHYKNIAPNYDSIMQILKTIFSAEYLNIVDLDYVALCTICSYLNIKTPLYIFSKMNIEIEAVHSPDEWALNICKKIEGVDEYWNPIGGMTFFDRRKYQLNQIDLKFQKVNLQDYEQKDRPFVSGLSIIDVLMFNSISKIREMLDNYELL